MKKIKIFIIFTLCVKQLVWASYIPPWQFPDEQAHFAQVQNFAQRGLTAFSGPNTSQEIYESEKLLGTVRDGFGNNSFTYHPEYKLAYSDGKDGLNEDLIRNFPLRMQQKYVIFEATVYPPFYYTLLVPFYNLGRQSDLLTRIFWVRLGNIPIFLGMIFLANRIGKVLFKSSQLVWTLTLIVSFHPMFSFVSAGTTSDNIFTLLVTLTLYVSLQTLRNGLRPRYILGMIVVLILGIYSKPQGRLVGLIFLYPLINNLLNKSRKFQKSNWVIISVLLVAIFGFMISNIFSGRQMLPEIPTLNDFINHDSISIQSHFLWTFWHTYHEILPWYWGVYRWLSLTYPRPIHRIINWTVLLAGFGVMITLGKSIRNKQTLVLRSNLFFLIYASLIYFLSITFYDFIFFKTHGFSFGVQGRYFFPVIVAHMALLLVGFVSIAELLKMLLRNLNIKVLGLFMIILHVYAQWYVVRSYYDASSLKIFFNQASQYKPYFLKSPFLELIAITYGMCLLILVWYYLKRVHEPYEKA